MTIGLALYGVSVGQCLFYIRFFPDDYFILRSVVFAVCVLESVNTFVTGSFYWRILVSCRQNTSYYCTLGLPWDLNVSIVTNCLVAFFVQCFYAHRVWIVSGQNKPLLCAVLATAWAQLIFGILFMIEANATNSITNTLYCPLNSLASAACDAIITISIWIYLRPLRNSLLQKDQYIDQFNLIFVQMGMITFATCVLMIIFYSQIPVSGSYLTAGPGAVLSKTYTNSMLAVLNARKPFRDREHANLSAFELPTIMSIS